MTERASPWHVELGRQPRRVIKRLPSDLVRRLYREFDRLAHNPRHSDTRPVEGTRYWRSRVGDWRIVYSIEDNLLLVLVVRIGPRGEVYRNL